MRLLVDFHFSVTFSPLSAVYLAPSCLRGLLLAPNMLLVAKLVVIDFTRKFILFYLGTMSILFCGRMDKFVA